MEGARASSLLDEAWSRGGDDESLASSIRLGIPEKGMPAWGSILSEAEIRSLVIYIHEQRAGPRGKSADPDVIPDGLVGSELHSFRVETVVAQGLEEPWSMAFLPDGQILITEKGKNEIRVIQQGKVLPEAIRETPKSSEGYGIYYEAALHPDYAVNGWIYLSYYASCNGCGNERNGVVLVRGRIRNGAWVDSQTLLETSGGYSLTGRIAFDDREHVFLSTGQTNLAANRTKLTLEPQDLSHGGGKIFRIRDDGQIPEDNPFVNSPNALPSIWSYGHRNPQGLAFNPHTAELWSTEHGPRGGDELNWIRGGRNYGWPIISYGMDYVGRALVFKTHQDGMEQPVVDWTPSIGISNLEFYEGNAFPNWRHNLFVSSLAGRTLYRLVVDDHHAIHREVILKGIGRIRDVGVGPDGYLYLLINSNTAEGMGKIVRLVPAE